MFSILNLSTIEVSILMIVILQSIPSLMLMTFTLTDIRVTRTVRSNSLNAVLLELIPSTLIELRDESTSRI